MHVCLLGPGTRRRYAICVYAPRVPLPGYLCVLTNATPRLATWHDMVTYLAFLVAVCGLPTGRVHAAAYLLSPFAPFRLLHKRACGWAVGTSRLRFVVTFYFCWRCCRSRLVSVA